MGFFKDARKGMSDAKKIGDYHGGMPAMRGAFKDLSAAAGDRGGGGPRGQGGPDRPAKEARRAQGAGRDLGREVRDKEGGDPQGALGPRSGGPAGPSRRWGRSARRARRRPRRSGRAPSRAP